jgi:hypothetical protein
MTNPAGRAGLIGSATGTEAASRISQPEVMELIAAQALDGLCRLCRLQRADAGFQLCGECARTAGGGA